MDFYTIASIVLTLAVIIGYINHRFVGLQATIAITIGALIISFGLIIIGEFGLTGIEHDVEVMLRQIPFRDLLINGMLSFLLFAGSLRIDIAHLKDQKWEIAVLALIGTIVSTLLVAILIYYILPLFGISLSFIYCLLFGALISPTDPIAVIATFKELGAPKELSVIVEGESLFNDGVAIVIFLTIYQLAFNGHQITWQATSLLFLRQAIGGVVYGGIIGLLAFKLMKPIDDRKIEILITLLIVTAAYTLARYLNISGPLAMVVAGIFIGNRGKEFTMPKESVENLENFWELIEEIINTILFLLIGLELLVIYIDRNIVIAALLSIPLVLLIRSVIVAVPMNIFKIWRRYPRGTVRILIWGGLRGGLALALALSLPSGSQRNLILGMTFAVIAFALIIQGITVRQLVKLTKK
jgi:CPA1 family monovalent cation:H+ antiporter